MEYKTLALESFFIVGVSVRTTNANNKAQQDIGALWDRIFTEDWASKIPIKLSGDIYSTYLDYEKDYTAPYTYVLGFKVPDLENIPAGFEGFTIAAAKYHVYTVKGKIPQCIHEGWMHIWHNEANRSYKADFEIFDEKAQNPENAEVSIYIAQND
ncbi:MAG: GyrI-like domain-containing protein [Sphingobacteriales bacterium JAD_PAG50586_3]|nr:MAG: GyrI-like domain-containing protein [Sphingobacteriales bacterium JAD_PAG50586_3]